MSYSRENRMIQTRATRFPLFNSIGSTFVCGPCYFWNTYQAPTIEDFQRLPHPGSTRISNIWIDVRGYWNFLNFRKETYLRSANGPVWFYQPEKCMPGPMCYRHSMDVEMVYGQFLYFTDNTDYWIYRGYVKDPNYHFSVWFSQDKFQWCCNRPIPPLPSSAVVMDTSDAHQNQVFTPSPPGFQQSQLMDFSETVENVHNSTRTGFSPESHGTRAFSTGQLLIPTPSSEINRNVGNGNHANHNSGQTTNCPNKEIPIIVPPVSRENSLEKNDTGRLNSTVTNSTYNDLRTVSQLIESKPLDTVRGIYDKHSINSLHASINIQASTDCKENGGSFAKPATVGTLPSNLKESKPISNIDSSDIKDQMADPALKQEDLKTVLSETEALSLSMGSKLSLNNGESNKKESSKVINHSLHELPSNFVSKPANNSEIKDAGQCVYSGDKGDSSSSSKSSGLTTDSPNGTPVQQNVTESGVQRTNEVFSVLQSRFRDVHERIFRKNGFSTGHKFQKQTASLKFDLTIMFQENGVVKRDDKMFSRRSNTTQEDILLLGPAGFGKTTLCSTMAYHWAIGCKDIKDFGLCIVCCLPKLDFKVDLNSFIVSMCNALLTDRNISAETVEELLSKHSQEIVILLDGYDQLPEDNQQDVLYFLNNRTVFQSSTIVVSSRPTSNAAFVTRFRRRVYIEGFSAKYLETMLYFIEVPDDSIKKFLCTVREQKLNYLKGLSPFFILTAANVVRKNYQRVEIFGSLYVLLDHVISYVVAEKMGLKKSDYHELDQFQLLGRMCFDKLVSGEEDFKEREMMEAFGMDMDFLIECNIFYMVSGRKGNVWRISSKVLTVFFATMYLRTSWLEAKDRIKFLEEVFCCSGCTSDYVIPASNLINPGLYYIGLIPEIVLKCSAKNSFDGSTFEMYYDLERIEHSQAFSAIGVLSRVSEKFLRRFGFRTPKKGDKSSEDVFNSVLNSISVNCCAVDYSFYYNFYEQKSFMKIVVTDPEDNGSILDGILKTSSHGNIDGMLVDFAFNKLDDVYPFVSNVLTRCLNRNVLYDNLKHRSLNEFVFQLILHLFDSDLKSPVIVSCTGDLQSIDRTCKSNCIFQVDPGLDKKGEKSVCVSRPLLERISNTYSKTQFLRDGCYIKYIVDDCKNNSQDIRISINIL